MSMSVAAHEGNPHARIHVHTRVHAGAHPHTPTHMRELKWHARDSLHLQAHMAHRFGFDRSKSACVLAATTSKNDVFYCQTSRSIPTHAPNTRAHASTLKGARTHTRTHARTHARTRPKFSGCLINGEFELSRDVRTLANMHTTSECTQVCTHTRTHACTHAPMHPRTHVCTYARASTHPRTHPHAHMHTCTDSHWCNCTLLHTHAHACMLRCAQHHITGDHGCATTICPSEWLSSALVPSLPMALPSSTLSRLPGPARPPACAPAHPHACHHAHPISPEGPSTHVSHVSCMLLL